MNLDIKLLEKILNTPATHEAGFGRFTHVSIDKDQARRVLSLNISNRAVVPAHAKRVAQDLKAGFLYQPHTPLCFRDTNNDGNLDLVEGQHRLLALVSEGLTGTFDIVVGLSTENIDAEALARTRTKSDALNMANKDATPFRNEIVSRLIQLDKGRTLTFGHLGNHTKEIMLNTLEDKLGKITQGEAWYSNASKKALADRRKMMKKVTWVSLYLSLREVDSTLAEEIMNFLLLNKSTQYSDELNSLLNMLQSPKVKDLPPTQRDYKAFVWVVNFFNGIKAENANVKYAFINSDYGRANLSIGGPFITSSKAGKDVSAKKT